MCNKVGYTNKQQAHQAMARLLREGKRMKTYRCPHCYRWHLTSKLKSY